MLSKIKPYMLRKPIVAVQFDGKNTSEIRKIVKRAHLRNYCVEEGDIFLLIGGSLAVRRGDFVVVDYTKRLFVYSKEVFFQLFIPAVKAYLEALCEVKKQS